MMPVRLSRRDFSAALLTLAIPPRLVAAQTRPAAIFVFDRPFWLNLHHFLYVLGRARNGERDSQRRAVAGAPQDLEQGLATLDAAAQEKMREGVAFYAAGISRGDVLFDQPLRDLGRAILAAGDRPTLQGHGVEPKLAQTLETLAPIYRRTWWPGHDAANASFIALLEKQVAQHGDAVLQFITSRYQEGWPREGFPVHVVAYANFAGAFSTEDGVLLMASLDLAIRRGLNALELAFHEAMHQWDDAIAAALRAAAVQQGVKVPAIVSHAMIFYTAGDAVRRVAPDHVPYAEAEGVWKRGMGRYRPALQAAWQPYLDGAGSRDAALAALVKAVAAP